MPTASGNICIQVKVYNKSKNIRSFYVFLLIKTTVITGLCFFKAGIKAAGKGHT
jgi:hypothetical protein